MGTLAMFQYTTSDMEDTADVLKALLLKSLVDDGLLTPTLADDWAANHTLIIRKKDIFRTLTDRWCKQEEKECAWYWLVVERTHDKGEP